jgi:hypothetical protein
VRWYGDGIELVRVLPVFVFLAIVMSIDGGGAGSCMGVAAGAGSQGAFFCFVGKSFCPGWYQPGLKTPL